MLEIEERDDARCLDLRHRDGERVVEHVDVIQTAPDPRRASAASAIASARSGMLRAARYSGTGTSGSPSPAPGAAGGVKTV